MCCGLGIGSRESRLIIEHGMQAASTSEETLALCRFAVLLSTHIEEKIVEFSLQSLVDFGTCSSWHARGDRR